MFATTYFVCLTLVPGAPLPPEADTIDTRAFQIPIHVKASVRDQIDELVLYVSCDKGKTWKIAAKAKPDQEAFEYLAPQDGLYWFTVQTILKDKSKIPSNISKAPPGLRVWVTTSAKGTAAELRGLEKESQELRGRLQRVEKRIAELKKKQQRKP